MGTSAPVTLHQGNDELIDIVVTPVVTTDDLSLVTEIRAVMKPSPCVSDTDSTTLTLSSSDPTQIVVTSQTSAQIEATVYVPSAALAEPYDRWWRVDVHVGTTSRTALYGPVTVVDL